VGNWVNWSLVIASFICVIIELAMGALTGFDLALVGASLAVGGGIGLLTGSAIVGMLAAAGVALIYFAVFRSWLKAKLTVRDQASNGDAVLGKTGVVIRRLGGSLDAYIWVNDLDPLHAKLKQRGAKIV